MFPLLYRHPRIFEAAIRLTQENNTPAFVYDEKTLTEAAKKITDLQFPYGFRPRYAIKANSQRNIIRLLDLMGIHFDASSEFEYYRLKKYGIEAQKIMLTSQQSASDPKLLLKNGVQLNASSLKQVEVYAKAAKTVGKALSIRINPGTLHNTDFKRNVSGVRSSFGIWGEDCAEAFALSEKQGVKIEALHIHIGSGVDEQSWLSACDAILEIARNYKQIVRVNLGGGFFVDRLGEEDTDIAKLAAGISGKITKFKEETGRELAIELEPGTYFVAKMGHLVARIDDIVSTGENGYRFIKLDAGMNDYLRCALYKAVHMITHIDANNSPHFLSPTHFQKGYVLVGHCCENGDLLSPNANEFFDNRPSKPGQMTASSMPTEPSPFCSYSFEKVNVGDTVILHGVGAYGTSMANNYNSYPLSPEYWLTKNNDLLLARKKQTLAQMTENEIGII